MNNPQQQAKEFNLESRVRELERLLNLEQSNHSREHQEHLKTIQRVSKLEYLMLQLIHAHDQIGGSIKKWEDFGYLAESIAQEARELLKP